MPHEKTRGRLIIAIILILIAVAGRLLPHVWNATPLIAVALFAGVYLGRNYAILLPLIAMFLSDLFLGFYGAPLMLSVYGSFVAAGCIGMIIKKNKNPQTLFLGTVGGSLFFFLITNWAVWQFSPWYTPTLSGLIESYTLAIPFFRAMLFGDLFYTFALFGVYELALLHAKNYHPISGRYKIFNAKQ